MKLKIQNFAKIKDADIILDGITVIAGKNNTGKSTVGKILDSMYNSTNNLETKDETGKKVTISKCFILKIKLCWKFCTFIACFHCRDSR